MEAYKKLEAHFADISRFGEVRAVMHWDMATNMPSGGAKARGEQLAMLKGIHHEMVTDPRVGQWLEEVGDGEGLSDWQQANVAEMRRDWLHQNCVPADLIKELSRKGSECEMVWRTARKDDDFARLAPYLQEVLKLTREVAAIKAEAFGVPLYDALLDQYEPGISSAEIDVIFDDLAAFLPPFLEEVLAYQATQPEPRRPTGHFQEATQKKLAQELMRRLGFDFDQGRLDTSHHPFCGGYPTDVRLTTFYDESNFLKAIMGVLHETGHALYTMGLPPDWRDQPVGKARGMAMHESQSLFVEMQVGRSEAFSRWVAPIYRDIFGEMDNDWSAENLYRVNTQVERSLIRVDADEVTYPAHVILRYRLEKAMIAGDLEIADLPDAWNEGMEELVGITPDDDRDGCMQDIHWMDGAIGYFPTYTLGALIAAQLFASADEELDGIEGLVEKGDFAPVIGWLGDKVHSVGSRLPTNELLVQATGRELDASFFKDHLRRRYLPK